jgi:integrase
MPRVPSVPSYRLHKPSGQAVVTLRHAGGVRRDVYLGEYNSPGSRREYARIVAELAVNPAPPPPPSSGDARPDGITVNEVLLAYVKHAEQHYRGPDGKPTGEFHHVKAVTRHLSELYGHTPAAEFGPLALKAVRQRFVAAGWCRRSVNQQVERVRRIFKWVASEELVPAAVYHALATVTGLQRGRTPAREPDPVGPVDDVSVDATLPHLNHHVRGLVEFQRLTGCRPGEACRVRRADIDTGGDVWLYRPPLHKGTWRGKSRVIPIGPKAQALLREFFTPDPDDHLFSPRRAVEEVRAERSARRKTPRYPSHVKRNAAKRKRSPKRTPAERYNRISYFVAVARACVRAFPPPGDLAQKDVETAAEWWERLTPGQRAEVKEWQKSHRWHPNQLRHSFATRVRREHGLEAAQVMLGHTKADVTQVYAERDLGLAVSVASEIG